MKKRGGGITTVKWLNQYYTREIVINLSLLRAEKRGNASILHPGRLKVHIIKDVLPQHWYLLLRDEETRPLEV